MNESQPNPNADWRNRTAERIDNPDKAAHMAVVEDKWRTFAQQSAELSLQQYDQSLTADVPSGDHWKLQTASQINSENARYTATIDGPAAVQEVADAYDRLHDGATLPPELPQKF